MNVFRQISRLSFKRHPATSGFLSCLQAVVDLAGQLSKDSVLQEPDITAQSDSESASAEHSGGSDGPLLLSDHEEIDLAERLETFLVDVGEYEAEKG